MLIGPWTGSAGTHSSITQSKLSVTTDYKKPELSGFLL